jgi:hypothetical protein
MPGLKSSDTLAMFSGVAARRLTRIIPIDSTKELSAHPAGSPLFSPAGFPLPRFFKPGSERYSNPLMSKEATPFEVAPRPAAPATVLDTAACISVEVISRNVELVPGETAVFYFRVSNSAPVGIWVELAAENSLSNWSAEVGNESGLHMASPNTLVPAQGKIIVTVEVAVPADARLEDRNRTTLRAMPLIATEPLVDRLAG